MIHSFSIAKLITYLQYAKKQTRNFKFYTNFDCFDPIFDTLHDFTTIHTTIKFNLRHFKAVLSASNHKMVQLYHQRILRGLNGLKIDFFVFLIFRFSFFSEIECLYHIIAHPYTPAPLHEATSKGVAPPAAALVTPWQYATNIAQRHNQPASDPARRIALKATQPPRVGVLCWLWATINPTQTKPAKRP